MKSPLFSSIALVMTVAAAIACKSAETKTVTFTLSSAEKGMLKPFADEEIAIFPVVDGKISAGDKNRLGLGRTDSKGHASIEFNAAANKDFVLLWRTKNIYMMMRNKDGQALTFKCENATCDLGDLKAELFEFSSTSG